LIFERIEAQANVDVTPEYITNNRTHYGDHFNNDEEIMFALFEKVFILFHFFFFLVEQCQL